MRNHHLEPDQWDALLDREGHEPCPGVEIIRDVEIQRVGDWRQHATIFRPATRPAKRSAAIVLFHGGGFTTGNPNGCGMLGKCLALALGMTTISASYRLSDGKTATFPKPVRDAGDAWRWVINHADDWQIDRHRVAIGGDSAGACIATLTLLTLDDPMLGGGGTIRAASVTPMALVAKWGPMDFVARWFDKGQQPGAEFKLLGVNYPDNPTLYHQASPLTHVRPGLPPAIFIYGKQDTVVHPRQGELARNAWHASGNHAELVLLDDIGHGVTSDNRRERQTFLHRIVDFLSPLVHAPTPDDAVP